jgi:hypothetical protein
LLLLPPPPLLLPPSAAPAAAAVYFLLLRRRCSCLLWKLLLSQPAVAPLLQQFAACMLAHDSPCTTCQLPAAAAALQLASCEQQWQSFYQHTCCQHTLQQSLQCLLQHISRLTVQHFLLQLLPSAAAAVCHPQVL